MKKIRRKSRFSSKEKFMQDKVFITNQSGDKLAAWILTGKSEPVYIMVICHGFRGAKENSGKLIPFARRLNGLGIGVVAFDCRGSGESDGDFARVTLSRQVADLKLVLSYVRERFRLPVLLLGRSFGGSTVAAAAPYDDIVAGCIFWSAPVNLAGTFKHMLGDDAYYRLLKGETINIIDQNGEFPLQPDIVRDFERHDLLSCLKTLDMPVLAIHGGQDEVVHSDNARTIAGTVKHGELELVAEADHRFTEFIRERENLTLAWIKAQILDYSGGSM
jgi:alpha-beta hydrolase superfamily lysophospholipase